MKKVLSMMISVLFLISCFAGCDKKDVPSADNPVTLTMWHVYGSQTESPLNDSIELFNSTVGKDEGIVVNVVSVSSSSAIDEALLAAVKDTPGVPELPDLFTAYPRVADIVGHDRLLDWNDRLTETEKEAFIPEFIAEGYFGDKLLMLPVAKSTELLFLNGTLYDRAIAASDIGREALSTFEGLFSACESYYDISCGKDMFQINDFYHYFLSGMAAFGEDFIYDGKLHPESDAFEKVWRPMARAGIRGGLCLGDGYASDRWKTGEVICNTGSTAGILYLRDYVTYEDNTTEDIQNAVLPYPRFENGKPYVVQRGGGLFALKNEDERKNKAAVVFAKWLTQKENNLGFVTKAGYLPVTKEAFDLLFENTGIVENEKYRLLYNAVSGMSEEYTYCSVPVYDGASETQSAFEKNVKSVLNNARNEYTERTSDGEDKETVLEELEASSLSQLRELYK